MLVGRGAMTFETYTLSGKNSAPTPEQVLERLHTFAFAGIEIQEEGAVQGWIGPEHLFDGAFLEDQVMRGPFAVFALRIDTRKVPGPLLQAHLALQELAACEAEGVERLNGRQRRELKLQVKAELLAELPPTQRAYGVFWNLRERRVHLQSTSKGVIKGFTQLFERSFELELEPRAPGVRAAEYAQANNVLQTLREARPLDLSQQTQTLVAV